MRNHRRVWRFLFLIGVISSVATAQAAPAQTHNGDAQAQKQPIAGLYQSEPKTIDNDTYWQYLRIYSDETVIEASTSGTPDEIANWFRKPYEQTGRYQVQGSTIRFSIGSPYGTVDYQGKIQQSGTLLSMDLFSHINGHRGHTTYHLVRPEDGHASASTSVSTAADAPSTPHPETTVPTIASGQSLKSSCLKNRNQQLDAFDQKQWELVVSKGREFMSICEDEGTEAAASVLFFIGFGLERQGKFEEAVPIFRRCSALQPDNTDCMDYLAEALDKQGEFGDVVPILQRCVTIKPDKAGCWVDLGIALDRAGRESDARQAYEQAISIGGYTEANAAAIELARDCLSHPQTAATFRGHRLGESWRTFTRTEEGLCQIKRNTENCSEAASGKEAVLKQYAKDGSVTFIFEYGRLAFAWVFMTGPAFEELTYFEKTYGEPSDKFSHPEKGTADSYWHFSDGGEAHAEERKSESGEFTITFTVRASDSALRAGALAANPRTPAFNGHILGESWQKFAQTGSGLCRASNLRLSRSFLGDTAQACKDAPTGKDAILQQYGEDGFIKASFTFESGRLTQADLNTRLPKFTELDYLDKTYGEPYTKTNDPSFATRRWDYADGGQVSATEIPNAQGFLIMISAKIIPSQ